MKDAAGEVTKGHKLDEDMNGTESIDPWLGNKLNSSSDLTPEPEPVAEPEPEPEDC